MRMHPSSRAPKTESETVDVEFKLSPQITSATIAGAVWSSEPSGLTFSGKSIAADGGKTAQAVVSGGDAGTTYVISAVVTLSTGAIVEPWLRMRVANAGDE